MYLKIMVEKKKSMMVCDERKRICGLKVEKFYCSSSLMSKMDNCSECDRTPTIILFY